MITQHKSFLFVFDKRLNRSNSNSRRTNRSILISIAREDTNLNSSTNDNAHKEVGDNTGNCHHQALNYSDTRVKAQHEEQIMLKAGMEANHEVTYSSRKEGDENKIRHRWDCVTDDKRTNAIMTIQSLPMENLAKHIHAKISIILAQPRMLQNF